MRIMGIDYGDKRVGIAISDPFGWTAQGIETIEWNGHVAEKLINRIKELIMEYKIEKIVMGFPKNMNGTIGERGQKTLEFIDILREHILGIEIICWDERLTTVSAKKVMIEMGTKKSKKKGLVDKIASTYILQSYLDSISNK